MKCLYYLAPSLESTHGISDDLHEVGIKDFFVHVISRDEAGLKKQHIHSSNYLETLDVVRDGIIGGVTGLLVGLLGIWLIDYFDPFGIEVPNLVYFALVGVATLFGTWEGGLIGIATENRKLAKFLREEMGVNFFEDAGLGIKPISPFASKRLVRKAIQYAIDNGRESVTLVHKGNIMKFTEGAFRNWGYEVAREEFGEHTVTEDELWEKHNGVRPEGKVLIKDRIADITFQLMQLRPAEFDVLATMNLNGDYLSDAIAAEVGGMGIAPGANMADHVAVFEATHGTAPKYANKDKVNPSSLMFSGCMMFDYIGWREVSALINQAFAKTVAAGIVTYDFARQMEGATEVSTSGFASALIERL
jgi:hypothetical protein